MLLWSFEKKRLDNVVEYREENYLMLSGIQHFLFCRRQWALIHIEQQWEENYRTVDGSLMHKNAHDQTLRTRRKDILTVKGMRIHSFSLGISGECDVVEFHQNSNGITLTQEEGKWMPYPIEYKRGTKKQDSCDEAQLCAQAMCLEEMLCCDISKGALYYGEERHRQEIMFTPDLRETVRKAVCEMHELYEKGYTPKVKPQKGCNSCSLKNLCVPKVMRNLSVKTYLQKDCQEEAE